MEKYAFAISNPSSCQKDCVAKIIHDIKKNLFTVLQNYFFKSLHLQIVVFDDTFFSDFQTYSVVAHQLFSISEFHLVSCFLHVKSYLIFLLCCLQSQGTSDSSFATNRKGRHIDLLLKFWEREYLRDFLQSCTSLTDTTKSFQ